MNRRRLVSWIVGCVVCLGIAAALAVREKDQSDRLPPDPPHANLPQQFSDALIAARRQIRATKGEAASLRKLAILYQANRFYKEAQACYHVIQDTSGGLDAHDHYYLADIAQADGDLERAQVELREVIKLVPRYLPARIALAEALFKSGQSEEASKEYTEVLRLDGDNLKASVGLARLELQQGNHDAAYTRLERLMAAHPETTQGADLLSHELSSRGEVERAKALTKGIREKGDAVPADPWIEALLAQSYDSQRLALRCEDYVMAGQIDEALPLLERLETLDPKNWIPHVLKGWSEGKSHHYNEGVVEYTKALEVGGDPDKICPLITSLLIENGKLSDAARLASVFYAKKPDSVPILISYADVAVRQGDEKTARILLPKLLEKEPYLYLPNMNYAKILWASGERGEAVKCLQRVANVFPKDLASRGLLAEYYLGLSDAASAIVSLEQALPCAPDKSVVRGRLTEMLSVAYRQAAEKDVLSGHLSEAAVNYEKMLKLSPNDLDACAALANCYTQLKDFKSAATVLEKMASYQPSNPTILLSLGDVLYQGGNATQARARWQSAVELVDSRDAELRNALDVRLRGQISPETFK